METQECLGKVGLRAKHTKVVILSFFSPLCTFEHGIFIICNFQPKSIFFLWQRQNIFLVFLFVFFFFFFEYCNVTEPTVFSTEFSFLLMEHFCFPLKYASKARNTLQHSWGWFFREFHSSPFSNGGFSVLLKSDGIKVRISNENYLLYFVYIKVFLAWLL